jgi:hypothetical protein
MEIVQHKFSQVARIREELPLVCLHGFLRRIKKKEYDSTERHILLVVFVLFFGPWSLTGQAYMDENPEKGFEVVDRIMEHTAMTMEVSLRFENFITSIWWRPLRVY